MVDFEQVNAAELTQQFVGDTANRLISKPVLQKTKHAKFSEKRTFLTTPLPLPTTLTLGYLSGFT